MFISVNSHNKLIRNKQGHAFYQKTIKLTCHYHPTITHYSNKNTVKLIQCKHIKMFV